MGAQLARRVVDHENGGRESRIEPREALAGQCLERGLQRASIASRITRSPGVASSASCAAWAATAGKGRRSVGMGSALAFSASATLMRPRSRARSSTRARARSAACGKRSGRRVSGDCGESYEECGLADREPLRFLAEIGEARGAQAFDIASVRCKPEVEIENLDLRTRLFDFDRADHLAQLGRDRTIRPRLEKARHLHGERRSARYDPAVQDHLQRRSHDRERVDPAMLREAAVLVGDQHAEIALVDIARFDRQSPTPVRRGEGAQQHARAIEHDGRCLLIRRPGNRPERGDRAPGAISAGTREQERKHKAGAEKAKPFAPLFANGRKRRSRRAGRSFGGEPRQGPVLPTTPPYFAGATTSDPEAARP